MAVGERLRRISLYFTNRRNVWKLFVLSRGLFSPGTCFLLLGPISVFLLLAVSVCLLALMGFTSLICRAGPSWSGPFSCGPAQIAACHESRRRTYACSQDERQNRCHSVH